MSTLHTVTACRSGSHPTMGDWEAEYQITFRYSPQGGPNYNPAHMATPGWPAEIEFVSISPGAGDHGAFSDLAQRDLEDWAEDWLYDNTDECIAKAERGLEPDPDAARDRRIDDELAGA